MKQIILVIGLVAALLTTAFGQGNTQQPASTAGTVNAQQSPPTSAQAKQIEAMVNKAAELVNKTGKAAFAEFRKNGSEWWSGNTYLFVYDLKSNVLLNPAFPQREGTNTTGQKDAAGKLFHHDFITTVQSKGSGWVDYMFPKPGQTQPSQKWSYVKAVNVDGTPGLIGAGFYPE
jgi:cytochrome c